MMIGRKEDEWKRRNGWDLVSSVKVSQKKSQLNPNQITETTEPTQID